MFEAEIGELLGLEIEKGERQPIAGIVEGAKREYFLHDIEIDIGGWPRNIRAGFMRDISRYRTGEEGDRRYCPQYGDRQRALIRLCSRNKR